MPGRSTPLHGSSLKTIQRRVPEKQRSWCAPARIRRAIRLKNHVDPRTYAYIRRFFALVNLPENEFAKYRPWLLNVMLSSPSYEHWELGIERYLQRRAAAKSKPVSGLESPKEHNAFFVDSSDRESEALLLILFINATREGPSATMVNAWRRGDVETLNRILWESFQDFPSLARRLIDMRNQNWLPKIDAYLLSGNVFRRRRRGPHGWTEWPSRVVESPPLQNRATLPLHLIHHRDHGARGECCPPQIAQIFTDYKTHFPQESA